MSHHSHTSPHAVTAHADHSDEHDVSKHVRGYLFVGGLLLLFTGITVALSYIDFGSQKANMSVGMAVATFKAGLVAAIFMHLKSEKATIWRFLIITIFFAIGLFALSLLAHFNPITR